MLWELIVPLEPGTKIGRFTIVRQIAQGGMAEVYRAEQELTSAICRPAAVKLIRAEYSESPDFREMFLDEARTACTLSHPNIVPIYEVGETESGQLFMAMELVTGETLSNLCRALREADERLSDDALFFVGISCCSALEAVHALRVEGGTVDLVHRDVSPHNLLVSSAGSLKLIDFGIAKAVTNRNLTMPGLTKGKAGYFSPEQAMGRKVDGRSDLFSLGVTLYKLASGVTPFDEHQNQGERHAALVRGHWRKLAEVRPDLPPGLYAVIDKALRVDPADRFQTARAMREALESAAFAGGVQVSQSALMGFVSKDGEINAVGGNRVPLGPCAPDAGRAVSAPGPLARSRIPTYEIPRVQPAPRAKLQRRRLWLGIVAVASSMAIGVFGSLLASGSLGGTDPARLPPPKGTSAASEAAAPVEADGQPHVPGATEAARPAPSASEGTASQPQAPTSTSPPAQPSPPQVLPVARPPEPPATRPARSRAKASAVGERRAAEPVAAAIPEGTGKLRISASNPAAVVGVLVNGEDWGSPPVNRGVRSGHFTVVLKLTNGRTSTIWKGPVYPDRITTLVFDVAEARWSLL